MHHLYLSYQPSLDNISAERNALQCWCVKKGIDDYQFLEEHLTSGRVSSNQISKLFRPVQPGDVVVAPSLTRMGRGINMLISVMRCIKEKGAAIVTIDDGRKYSPDATTESLIQTMEFTAALVTRIKAERSNEALDKAKSDGKSLGRPVGSKKAEHRHVLYGKIDLLERLHAQGDSQSEIARALGVSRGTVSNYLKSKSI